MLLYALLHAITKISNKNDEFGRQVGQAQRWLNGYLTINAQEIHTSNFELDIQLNAFIRRQDVGQSSSTCFQWLQNIPWNYIIDFKVWQSNYRTCILAFMFSIIALTKPHKHYIVVHRRLKLIKSTCLLALTMLVVVMAELW